MGEGFKGSPCSWHPERENAFTGRRNERFPLVHSFLREEEKLKVPNVPGLLREDRLWKDLKVSSVPDLHGEKNPTKEEEFKGIF